MRNNITLAIFNYNGFRKPTFIDKGRIEITLDSLLKNCPFIIDMNVRFIDNESTDGSDKYLANHSLGEVVKIKRLIMETSWEATTKNNIQNLYKTLQNIDTPYLWRIEDDSYYYNSNDFLKSAVEVLESDKEIDIIHLRKWTKYDAEDMPGVGRNLNRISETRITPQGKRYFVLEKRPEDLIWIPLFDDIDENFIPDKISGYGLCPIGDRATGSVRINKYGNYERLLTEKWATYTNHGWICRTSSLKYAFKHYNPKKEGDLANIFKKHFRAAKLNEDAFISFGWRTRLKNMTTAKYSNLLEWLSENNKPSCETYGLVRNKSGEGYKKYYGV